MLLIDFTMFPKLPHSLFPLQFLFKMGYEGENIDVSDKDEDDVVLIGELTSAAAAATADRNNAEDKTNDIDQPASEREEAHTAAAAATTETFGSENESIVAEKGGDNKDRYQQSGNRAGKTDSRNKAELQLSKSKEEKGEGDTEGKKRKALSPRGAGKEDDDDEDHDDDNNDGQLKKSRGYPDSNGKFRLWYLRLNPFSIFSVVIQICTYFHTIPFCFA